MLFRRECLILGWGRRCRSWRLGAQVCWVAIWGKGITALKTDQRGIVIFVFGFVLWVIDNSYCGALTSWKRSIGMPWSFALELHGWWHFFTGIGAYICMYSDLPSFYLLFTPWLCRCLNRTNYYRKVIALVEYLTSEDAGKPVVNNNLLFIF